MDKGLKRTIIWSGVAGATITAGYFLYRSIMKAIYWELEPKKFQMIKADLQDIQFKIWCSIKNPSDLKVTLTKQEYDIYINGVFITTLKGFENQIIYPEAFSVIELDVNLKTQELKDKLKSLTGNSLVQGFDLLTNWRSQKLRLVSKISLKYGILPSIPIEVDYEDTFKGWGY